MVKIRGRPINTRNLVRKITEIVDARCHSLRPKCTKFDSRCLSVCPCVRLCLRLSLTLLHTRPRPCDDKKPSERRSPIRRRRHRTRRGGTIYGSIIVLGRLNIATRTAVVYGTLTTRPPTVLLRRAAPLKALHVAVAELYVRIRKQNSRTHWGPADYLIRTSIRLRAGRVGVTVRTESILRICSI